jgi:conjugal transfer/entry exclusion protein
MIPTGFSDLSIDQKFKSVRDDIRDITKYANAISETADGLEASLAALRRHLEKLTKRVEALE